MFFIHNLALLNIPLVSVGVPMSNPSQAILTCLKIQPPSFFSLKYIHENHDILLVSYLCLAEHQTQANLHHLQLPS